MCTLDEASGPRGAFQPRLGVRSASATADPVDYRTSPWDPGWRRSLLRRDPVKEPLANGEVRDDRPFAVHDLNS